MSTTNSNKGIIFEYKKRDGTTQNALALYSDQRPEFSKYGKVFLRLLDEEFNQKKDGAGKNLVGLKHKDDLKHLGFQD